MNRQFYIHWIHLHIFVFISNVCLCANYVKEWDDNANSDSNQDSGSQTRKPQVHYGALPPPNYRKFHIHPNESLSRQYHLEDFLWTGSGDGPAPSETDGGLAWEDNDSNIKNPEPDGDGVIRVTKTMVLFRTIHTTVYPIEYTPTMVVVVVPSLISPSESYNYGSGFTPRLVTVPLVTSSPTFSLPGPEPGPDTTDILLSSSNNLYFGHSVPSPTPVPKSPIPDKSASVEPDEIDSNNISPTTKTGGTEVPLPDIHTLEPNTTTTTTTSGYIANPLYWVLTTIKIDNDSLDTILTHAKMFESEPGISKKSTPPTSKNIIFKREIERTLANVYATAFKRHLLSSLGVEIEGSAGVGGETGGNAKGEAKGGRKKRQVLKFNSSKFEIETKLVTKIKDREEIDYDTGITNNNTEAEVEMEFYNRNKYFSGNDNNGSSSNVNTKTTNGLILGLILRNSSLIPSNNPLMMQMQRNRRRALALVAATVLNVTVTVVNMSQVDSLPQMNLNYIVWAEGNPVPASSAVEDLQMVTQEEMEKEIGYEVVNKAEALVASPLKEPKVELATSPWLIVAMVSIAFVIILLVVLMLMIWKWKSNRLGSGDSSGRSRIVTPPPILRGRPESGSRSRHVDVAIETTSSAGGQGSGIDNLAFLGPPSPIERSEVPLQWPLHRKKIEYKPQSDLSEEASDQDQDLSQGHSKHEGQGNNGEDQTSHHRHYKRNHKAKSKSKTRPKSAKKSDLETIQERQSSLSTNLDRIITPDQPQFQHHTGNDVDQNEKMEAKKRRSSHHHKHKHISVSPSSSEGSSSVSESNSSLLSGTEAAGTAAATAGNGGESSHSDKLRKKKLSKSPTSSPSEKLRKQLQTIESQLQKGSPATTVSDNQSSNSMTTTHSRSTNSQKSQTNKPKSSDMISYGNLEVCQETMARPMSSKARKILKTKQDQDDNTVVFNVTKHRSSKRYEREEIETVEVTTEESFHRKRKSSGTGNNGRSSGEEEKTTSSVSKDSRSRKEKFSHLSSESLLSSSGGSSSSTDRESEERELGIKKKIRYLGSRGGGVAASGGNSNSENPIGKMRKRFHRFLDDAFNVAADTGLGKLDDGDSHSVPEETGSTTDEFSLRPKSASFGPPKSAWGSKIKPDRRGASATSKPKSAQSEQSGRKSAVKFSENLEATRIFERDTTDDSEINPNLIPSPSLSPSRIVTASGPSTVIYDDGGGHFCLNLLKPEPIFPNYPIYPDIPIIPTKGVESGSTNLNVSENRPFHPNPAIPLILAIKEEIKRFEKVKNTKESNLMTSTSGNAQP